MIEYNKEIKLSNSLIHGYQYFCDASHPLSICGIVTYHRHVASMKIGRWLKSEENVHHIDGNKINNSPENLMVLSRAEHARLEKSNGIEHKNCKECGIEITNHNVSGYCIKHNSYHTRKFEISKEELENLISNYPITEIATLFEVSDKIIHRRCEEFGITKKPRGFWLKIVK